MSMNFVLTGLRILSKDTRFKKSNKISKKKIYYGCYSEAKFDKENSHLKIINEVTISDAEKHTHIYAVYKIEFQYEYKSLDNERQLVIDCLWDSFITTRGILFSELNSTPLSNGLMPLPQLENIVNKLEKVSVPKRQKRKAKAITT